MNPRGRLKKGPFGGPWQAELSGCQARDLVEARAAWPRSVDDVYEPDYGFIVGVGVGAEAKQIHSGRHQAAICSRTGPDVSRPSSQPSCRLEEGHLMPIQTIDADFGLPAGPDQVEGDCELVVDAVTVGGHDPVVGDVEEEGGALEYLGNEDQIGPGSTGTTPWISSG